MNLIIDIGNSYTKVAIFYENKVIFVSEKLRNDYESVIKLLNDIFSEFKVIKKCILSSVISKDEELIQFLTKQPFLFMKMTNSTKIPIKNLYKTPQTLGKDRLAAVVGANNIFPDKNVLVFDAGTALTIDFINSKNEYEGGNISPGLKMRFRALHEFTQKLPELNPENDINFLLGRTTNEAIIAGVQNSLIFEIQNYISIFEDKYPDLKIFFTGGDTIFFENKLKKNIFAKPNLVLTGLNRILEYNV